MNIVDRRALRFWAGCDQKKVMEDFKVAVIYLSEGSTKLETTKMLLQAGYEAWQVNKLIDEAEKLLAQK